MGVLKNLSKALGLYGVPAAQPGLDRISQLEESVRTAQAKIEQSREALEGCHIALEEQVPGAADQLEKAEAEVAAAEQIEARLGAALRAARKLQSERQRKEREQAERKAWQVVAKANAARIEQARELTSLIERAGALYKALAASGHAVYEAMPRKPYNFAGMLLDEGTVYSAVGVELAKHGLPSSVRLSSSMVLGMPGLVEKVEDSSRLSSIVFDAAA